MSLCGDELIHPVGRTLGLVCLLINIFIPGIGTIVHAVSGPQGDPHQTKKVIFGIVQFFTAFLLFGWIWSIIYGVKIFNRADSAQNSGYMVQPR